MLEQVLIVRDLLMNVTWTRAGMRRPVLMTEAGIAARVQATGWGKTAQPSVTFHFKFVTYIFFNVFFVYETLFNIYL